jgi:signal transduction histidine kinase
VQADRNRLMQVFNNLLHNALSHTPAGGRITVSVKREADHARIDMRDTGTGIPADEIAYVFERFYRVDGSRSRTTGGAGLGLAIVKALVETHQGTVSASSTGVPGEGTVFTVLLPVLDQQADDDAPTAHD